MSEAKTDNPLLALMKGNGAALLLYKEDVEALMSFDRDLRLEITDGIFAWFVGGMKDESFAKFDNPLVQYVAKTIASKQMRNVERYAELCRKRAEWGKKGGKRSASKRQANAQANAQANGKDGGGKTLQANGKQIETTNTITKTKTKTNTKTNTLSYESVNNAHTPDTENPAAGDAGAGEAQWRIAALTPDMAAVLEAAILAEVPEGYARHWHGEMERIGWVQTNGKRITRHTVRSALRSWWLRDKDDWRDEPQEACRNEAMDEIKAIAAEFMEGGR